MIFIKSIKIINTVLYMKEEFESTQGNPYISDYAIAQKKTGRNFLMR